MRFSFSLIFLILFRVSTLFSMPDGSLIPPPYKDESTSEQPSPRSEFVKESPCDNKHLYSFPESMIERIYHIQQYPPPKRKHATIRRGLGQTRADARAMRKGVSIGLRDLCSQDPHKFILYSALRNKQQGILSKSWFENPWYCLIRLTEEKVALRRIEAYEESMEKKKLELLEDISTEEDLNFCETMPLNIEQKYGALHNFLPDTLKEQHKKDCEREIYTFKYVSITTDELAMCDKTIKKFVEFLTDEEGKLQFGPIDTYVYEFSSTIRFSPVLQKQLVDFSYHLKKRFPDYANYTNAQFSQTKDHADHMLTYWPTRYANEKKQLQKSWNMFKVYKLQ